jgi:hypothetical protein
MRILFVNVVGPTDISAVETETVHQLYTTIGLQTDLANRTSEIASLLKRRAHIPRRAILLYAQSTGTLAVDWLIADICNHEAHQNPDSGLFDTNPYGLLSE